MQQLHSWQKQKLTNKEQKTQKSPAVNVPGIFHVDIILFFQSQKQDVCTADR